MKKLIAAVFAGAVLLAGCGSSDGDQPALDGAEKYVTYWPGGEVKDDGQVASDDGRRVGQWRGYHESGQLMYEGEYDGEPKGEWRRWHAGGSLRWTGEYPADGGPATSWTEYNPDGSVRYSSEDI